MKPGHPADHATLPSKNRRGLAGGQLLPSARSKGSTTSMTEHAPVHTLSAETLESLRTLPVMPAVSAGVCSCPIKLVGSSTTVDKYTGEVVSSFASAQLPGGRLTIACGNRRQTVCPACSRIYAGDAFQLISTGLFGGKSIPLTVSGNPRVFATFTAPSFGAVHLGPNKKGVARPCHPRRDGSGCNRWHRAGDPAVGTPLDPSAYDYVGAVLWNASSSALWARFTINLRRDLARLAGLTVAEFRAQASMAYAKVAEYQARGSIHFHAVVRIDGPDGPGSTAPAWASHELLTDAIRVASLRSAVTTPATHETPPVAIEFGTQVDVRAIKSDALATGDVTERAVAGYIAKYATKSAHSSGTLDRSVCCRECVGAGHHGTYQFQGREIRRVCRRCLGTGLAVDLAGLKLSAHLRRMIETSFRLGDAEEFAALKLRRWAHMLGFRGHFLTKARRYSITFATLREARREHARQERNEYLVAFGLLEPDAPDVSETVVIGEWSYAGREIRSSARTQSGGAP